MNRLIRVLGTILLATCPFVNAQTSDNLHWLKNNHMEAAFSAENGIRLEVVRVPGGENFLRQSTEPVRGLKTWVMAPSDLIELRDCVSELSGEIDQISEREMRLQAEGENPLGLSLEWLVELSADEAELKILHRLHHRGELPLHLAVWSIAALAPGTNVKVPFSRSPSTHKNLPNNLAIFPYTDIADGRLSSTEEALNFAIRVGPETRSVKVGLVQHEGRFQINRGGRVLESTAPYDSAAEYPEGGSNVTLYSSPANRDTTMGEAEVMGPLQVVKPGDYIELQQTLRIRD